MKSNLKEKTARTNKAVLKKKKKKSGSADHCGQREEEGTDVFLYKLLNTI